MSLLPLLVLAVSAASALAESTVHFREQFEDGGEARLLFSLTFISGLLLLRLIRAFGY